MKKVILISEDDIFKYVEMLHPHTIHTTYNFSAMQYFLRYKVWKMRDIYDWLEENSKEYVLTIYHNSQDSLCVDRARSGWDFIFFLQEDYDRFVQWFDALSLKHKLMARREPEWDTYERPEELIQWLDEHAKTQYKLGLYSQDGYEVFIEDDDVATLFKIKWG